MVDFAGDASVENSVAEVYVRFLQVLLEFIGLDFRWGQFVATYITHFLL